MLTRPVHLAFGADEPFQGDLLATCREFCDRTRDYWVDWVRGLPDGLGKLLCPRRRNHALGAANEQLVLQHMTQPGQSVTHCRLAEAEAPTGPCDVSFLHDGVEDDELDRVRAGLKSSLIMAEESTSSRAGSLASDWYYLGRVRSSEEIKAAIDALTPAAILGHLGRYPARDFTVVTLGPQPLKLT